MPSFMASSTMSMALYESSGTAKAPSPCPVSYRLARFIMAFQCLRSAAFIHNCSAFFQSRWLGQRLARVT